MSDATSIKTKPATISAERLKSFVERIEKLEEERKAIGGDIRDVYSEAKGGGFDVKTMRKLIALRKMDAADRDEQEAILDVYRQALGMLGSDNVDLASLPVPVGEIDRRAVRVLDLHAQGRSYREIEDLTGVPKSTAARLVAKARESAGAPVPRDSDSDDGTGGNGTESGEDEGANGAGGKLAGTEVTISSGFAGSRMGKAVQAELRAAGASVTVGDTSIGTLTAQGKPVQQANSQPPAPAAPAPDAGPIPEFLRRDPAPATAGEEAAP